MPSRPAPSPVNDRVLPALVIGAGPAGLAVSRELKRRGVEHLVLERDRVGASWAGYYRSLVLHTGKHLTHLPDLPFPRETPLFPSREQFLAYLGAYASHFGLPVREGTTVVSARREGDRWIVETDTDRLAARALVVATGIAANPHRPALEGEDSFGGIVMHSAEYGEPAPLVGKRVLVVGVGNSGGEIAAELGRAGVSTALSVRSGAHLMPLRILGLPAQYWSVALSKLPAPLPEWIASSMGRLRGLMREPPLPRPDRPALARPPLIGDSLPAALRSGSVTLRGDIDRLVPGGVRFRSGEEEPFDVVLLATGFRPAVSFLRGLDVVDERGFPRQVGVRSADQPALFFVGHRYGPSGAIHAIRSDAPRAAREIAELLAR